MPLFTVLVQQTLAPLASASASLLSDYVRSNGVAISAKLPLVTGQCLVLLGTMAVNSAGNLSSGPLPTDAPDLATRTSFAQINGLFWLGTMPLAEAIERFGVAIPIPTDGTTPLVCAARGSIAVFSVGG